MADMPKKRANEQEHIAEIGGERLSFVPGTPRKSFDLHWREAVSLDFQQIGKILRANRIRVGKRLLTRAILTTGFTVRVVLRNKLTIVAFSVVQHILTGAEGAEYNDVKAFWVHPDYTDTKVLPRLLALARLELPERPTRLRIPAEHEGITARLLSAGSKVVDGYHYFADLAGREYRAALAKSRPAS